MTTKSNDGSGIENNMNVGNEPGSPSSRKRPRREEDCGGLLLSPEQRQRALASRLHAKIVRASRQLSVLSPTIGPTWFAALESEFEKPYFSQLSSRIEAERRQHTVYPSQEEVWSWTTRTPIHDTRVVILGNHLHRHCIKKKRVALLVYEVYYKVDSRLGWPVGEGVGSGLRYACKVSCILINKYKGFYISPMDQPRGK
jgi:hypothetical protein